jgi:transposase InsO family protein
MDIKMVWIEGLRRYGFVLTILDVFTPVVLHWELGFHMRQADVECAWGKVIENHLEPNGAKSWETHIEIRSDNGPQFCANKLRQFFKGNYLMQTYTHPYTPQENGHIESFHAILARSL